LAEILFAESEIVEPLDKKIAFLSLTSVLRGFTARGDQTPGD